MNIARQQGEVLLPPGQSLGKGPQVKQGQRVQDRSTEQEKKEFFLFLIFFIKSFTKIIFHFEN
jgi:hypothetical protein